ncbi:MAG: DUF421 domain-containing protein [Candidatus Limiplasma sp.]|nr:DUF421 domain-containing protein [Candidatus Limiplasma sp.]
MAELLQGALFSILSVVALFFMTKLLGNRQMSQLTLFDYIAGISIGSIAAEIATHPDEGGWVGLVAMAIYGGVTWLTNLADDHSLRLRRFILGEPLVLFSQGTLYFQNLKKAKLDLNEFLTECRSSGYFDLSQLQLVILEVNGKLSFLPLAVNRPLTPADMGQSPVSQEPCLPVILDGRIVGQALHSLGYDENWLRKGWERQGFARPEEILLGMANRTGDLTLYEKTEQLPGAKF